MIAYYGEMVRTRREADRRFKPQSKCRPTQPEDEPQSANANVEVDANTNLGAGVSNGDQTDPIGHDGKTLDLIERFRDVRLDGARSSMKLAAALRRKYRIECNNKCEQWDCHREVESPDPVTIILTCECGRVTREIALSFEELRQLAEESLF